MIRYLFIFAAISIGFCSFGLCSLGYAEAVAGPLLQPYVDIMNNKLYTLEILHEQNADGQKSNMHYVYSASGDRIYEKLINDFNGNEYVQERLSIGDKLYDLSGQSKIKKGKREFFGNKISYVKGMRVDFSRATISYLLGNLFPENKLPSCNMYSGSGEENIRGKILQYEEYVPENDMFHLRGRYYFDQGKLVACVVIQNFEYEGKEFSTRHIVTFKQFTPEADTSLLTIPENIKQIEAKAVIMGNQNVRPEGSISYD